MASGQHSVTVNYWPGGIPAHIVCRSDPVDEITKEDIKGWFLFLEESYTPSDPNTKDQDPNYELKQRRRLISQWASMSQEARDAYTYRALPPTSYHPPASFKRKDMLKDQMPFAECNCIASLVENPRNRALWTKVRILTYHLQGDDGPMLDAAALSPNPDSGEASVTPETFMRWCYLESAQFYNMAMTGQGTVVFLTPGRNVLFADQEALDTGRLLMCDLGANGNVTTSARVQVSLIPELYLHAALLGRDVYGRDVLRHSVANAPVDLALPILDVLEEQLPYFAGGIDEWMDDIERYAPGYLDLEEAGDGMAPEYDHARFRSMAELEDIPRAEITK